MHFNIKDTGDIYFIIGIKFEKHQNGYIMHQKGYNKNLLNKFKLMNC